MAQDDAPATTSTTVVATTNPPSDVAAELQAFSEACSGGDDLACEELFQLESSIAEECAAGDTFSCAVVERASAQPGDLLCVSWDDLVVAELLRSSFGPVSELGVEEQARLADAEALRSASLAAVAAELGPTAPAAVTTAIDILELLPIGTVDVDGDIATQMAVLTGEIEPICA